jgi:hypothetical protein
LQSHLTNLTENSLEVAPVSGLAVETPYLLLPGIVANLRLQWLGRGLRLLYTKVAISDHPVLLEPEFLIPRAIAFEQDQLMARKDGSSLHVDAEIEINFATEGIPPTVPELCGVVPTAISADGSPL